MVDDPFQVSWDSTGIRLSPEGDWGKAMGPCTIKIDVHYFEKRRQFESLPDAKKKV